MKRREAPILAALFLDLTAFGMVLPDVQLHARALGAAGWLVGALLASMFVVQLVASPRWGLLSDRIGRKPVLLACTALSLSGWAVYALSTNLWLILVSRVLAGLGAANVVTTQAFLADASEPDHRAAVMGRAGAAMSGGLILGPALGMRLAAHGGTPLLGWSAAACEVAALLILALAVPRLATRGSQGQTAPRGLSLELLRDLPALRSLVLLAAVSWFALASLEGTFGRLVTEHFRWPATVFGDVFSFESLLGAIVQGTLLVWLARRWSQPALLRVGYLLTGVGLVLTPYATALPLLFLFSGLFSVGSALANPTINSSCSSLAPEDRQGELFGLLQSARSVGFLLGPAIGGALFDWRPEAPYLLAGGVGLLAAILVPPLRPSSAA